MAIMASILLLAAAGILGGGVLEYVEGEIYDPKIILLPGGGGEYDHHRALLPLEA